MVPKSASRWNDLLARYGVTWCTPVFAHWASRDERYDDWTRPPRSSYSRKSIEDASRPIVALLAAAAIAGDRDLQSTIVERFTSERDYPAVGAIAVLRAGIAHGAAMPGLGSLHADWTRAFTVLVATPRRAPGDWSIMTQLGRASSAIHRRSGADVP